MVKPKLPSPKERAALELLIAHGELYGLELVRESNGALKRGTIYVLLDRMELAGLVESRRIDPPEGAGGLPRRLYEITGDGVFALEAFERLSRGLVGQT